MKTVSPRHLLLACLTLLGTLPWTGSSRADTLLQLNFSSENPTTNVPSNARTISGFDNVCANMPANTPMASISNIDGTGASFSITNVGAYDSGKNTEPLTTSGFYTFGNNSNPHTFTLSGLTPGTTVTLYAVAAWDGNGRGGTLSFGGTVTQAQTVGDPGVSPTLANFTQINTVPYLVDASGTVTGTLDGAGGVGSASEGQVGGFIFDIAQAAAVPEPATLAVGGLLFAFAAPVAVRRLRRRTI